MNRESEKMIGAVMIVTGVCVCALDIKSFLAERKKSKALKKELAEAEQQLRVAEENADSWKINSDAVEKLIEGMEKAKEQERIDPNSDFNRIRKLVETAEEAVKSE